ncbi:DUF427 domain-containing protein [Pontimonas sp.]|jgi:uncharacterized protein (DUF427 family)|uniref:DUF427 domain-containing protein n=1 Tax=Pontimonas sp. TaxID=2304492 RepID=UPI0028709C55|nr:DUF427 domain-containing protein [Pontimonas sp.]MDR9396024.1 DUF427 domain-containing protein [Pontimonas sp.]MDR9434416.1 DUF427 domain-containing protein [Pontimonas sp.]
MAEKEQTPESVWDYPRPPALDESSERVVVTHRGVVIADSTETIRVLETSHPPTYYIPLKDFTPGLLEPVAGQTMCEFKGAASYADLVLEGGRMPRAVWWYPTPHRDYTRLADHAALYPAMFDDVRVNGEKVVAQEGDFYGGWITSRVQGPFKGAPGTWGW